MKLSILICTVPKRVRGGLPELVEELERQIDGRDIEYLYLGDNKKRSVGRKRNDLLSLAQGDYVVFIDDDDWIRDGYVDRILLGIEKDVDVVCFKVLYVPNQKEVIYSGNFVKDRETKNNYERLPNHIMVVRRRLAREVGFIDMSFAEDSDFARRLSVLLKSQCSIDEVLYEYRFSHEGSETQ